MFKKTSYKSSIKIQTALVASQPLTTMTSSNHFEIENKESAQSARAFIKLNRKILPLLKSFILVKTS